MIRSVIFDFNGVLVDDEAVHFELFREVLAEEGVVITEQDYHERYLGYDDRGCFATVLSDNSQIFDTPTRRTNRAKSPSLYCSCGPGITFFPLRGRDPHDDWDRMANRDLLRGPPFRD